MTTSTPNKDAAYIKYKSRIDKLNEETSQEYTDLETILRSVNSLKSKKLKEANKALADTLRASLDLKLKDAIELFIEVSNYVFSHPQKQEHLTIALDANEAMNDDGRAYYSICYAFKGQLGSLLENASAGLIDEGLLYFYKEIPFSLAELKKELNNPVLSSNMDANEFMDAVNKEFSQYTEPLLANAIASA